MPEKGLFLSKNQPFHGYTAASLISPKTLRCLLLYGILHESVKVCECESHCRGYLTSVSSTYSLTHTQSTQPLCVCDESYVSIRLCIENIKEKERLSVYERENE